MKVIERYKGCLLGLAVGDALGTTLEFSPPNSFVPIKDMVGGGPFNLHSGQWTDDTSMALCLAESLMECEGHNPIDQMERYLKWYEEGYLSSTGECFDIGNTVLEALEMFKNTRMPYSLSSNPRADGNGSLMRLAPIPLFYAVNPEEAIEKSGDGSLTTHRSIIAYDACRYMGGLIVGAIYGGNKEELLSERFSPTFNYNYWDKYPLTPEIDEISRGSFKNLAPPEIKGSGYVVKSLEAALWAFYHSGSFEEGCLKAVNLGDDADTTGAIYGQLAGVYYGENEIPEEWKYKIYHRQMIELYAEKLFKISGMIRNCEFLELSMEQLTAIERIKSFFEGHRLEGLEMHNTLMNIEKILTEHNLIDNSYVLTWIYELIVEHEYAYSAAKFASHHNLSLKNPDMEVFFLGGQKD